MRAALLLCAALAGPGIAVAQPAAPAPAAHLTGEEAAIARAVKDAAREGFERHELERALSIYTPDAAWILGRRDVPDAHDVRLDLARVRALLALRYALPPNSKDQMFFRDVEVEVDGDRATMSAIVVLELFNGREELHHRYRLVRRDGAWRVVERRTWPAKRQYLGMPVAYDDDRWLEAEAEVERLMADGAASPEARLVALSGAGHLRRAWDETKAWTARAPKTSAAWRARALFALEVGEVADAVAAAKKARALDPKVALPAALRHAIGDGAR